MTYPLALIFSYAATLIKNGMPPERALFEAENAIINKSLFDYVLEDTNVTPEKV